jgi:hypothetical protein
VFGRTFSLLCYVAVARLHPAVFACPPIWQTSVLMATLEAQVQLLLAAPPALLQRSRYDQVRDCMAGGNTQKTCKSDASILRRGKHVAARAWVPFCCRRCRSLAQPSSSPAPLPTADSRAWAGGAAGLWWRQGQGRVRHQGTTLIANSAGPACRRQAGTGPITCLSILLNVTPACSAL